jgi:DHA2 family multidrug resistance protein-like MFS transporter
MRRRVAIAGILLAMAAAVLDASSVNIALPSIATALHVQPAIAAWLVISYQAALVAGLLPLAAIGERFGYRLTFIAGATLFGISAGASSLAPGFGLLLAFRVLQGIGAAAIMALGVALLRQTVTEGELGKAIGWNAMTVALMSAAGPAIGAGLLGFGSWRFVFAGSVALAAGSLIGSFALLSRNTGRRELDGIGMMIYVSIVPAFVIAAGLAHTWATASLLLLLAGSIGLLLLLRRDLVRGSPFLPLDLLRSPAFRRSVLASVACFTGLSLALLMLPFALHSRLGLSAQETAMMLTPWPLAVLATTPITARLLERIQPSRLCAAGGAVLSCGLAALAVGSMIPGAAVHWIGIILCGIGFGLFQTPNNRTMFLAAPVGRAASAGGVQGTARLTGQVMGALAASALLSAVAVQAAAAFAFWMAAVATLTAAAISVAKLRKEGKFQNPGALGEDIIPTRSFPAASTYSRRPPG